MTKPRDEKVNFLALPHQAPSCRIALLFTTRGSLKGEPARRLEKFGDARRFTYTYKLRILISLWVSAVKVRFKVYQKHLHQRNALIYVRHDSRWSTSAGSFPEQRLKIDEHP